MGGSVSHFEPHVPWTPPNKEEKFPQQGQRPNKFPIPIGPTDV